MRTTAVRAATVALFAALTAWAGASSAQRIEPYYPDTSDYDSAAFRVIDHYPVAAPGCLHAVEEAPTIAGSTIRLSIRLQPTSSPDCPYGGGPGYAIVLDRVMGAGTKLSAGNYAVEFGYLHDGAWVPRATGALHVDDGRNKCSRMPESNVIIVESPDFARMAAVAKNPALDPALHAALLRPVDAYPFLASPWVNLSYFALDDIHDIARKLVADPALRIAFAEPNAFVCFMAVLTPLALVEFFNTQLGHYFMTADAAEIASIESGGSGPGWQRTGEVITGYVADTCSPFGASWPAPLYRFHGAPGRGPNSHFFTADRSECGQVRADSGWKYESTPFRVWSPQAGRCPGGSLPVFRLYNDRAAHNDSNHRYTSKASIVDQMVAAGWRNEGVTFCIPQR